MTARTLHDRLTGWHLRVRLAMASQRLELPFAAAAITADLPAIHDLNLVMVVTHVPAAVLLRSIERIAATAGWLHRLIEIGDADVAQRLRGPLLDAGYAEERLVTMELHSPPSTGATAVDRSSRPAAIVTIDEHRDLARAVTAQQPWADRDEVIDQMLERERRLAHVAGARAVVAPPATPVSRCLLLTDPSGGLVEIDAVSTLVDQRGQGWSRAVMRCAVREALDQGATHVVLVADEEDWPRTWYERLGFRVAGHASSFTREPPD